MQLKDIIQNIRFDKSIKIPPQMFNQNKIEVGMYVQIKGSATQHNGKIGKVIGNSRSIKTYLRLVVDGEEITLHPHVLEEVITDEAGELIRDDHGNVLTQRQLDEQFTAKKEQEDIKHAAVLIEWIENK